MTMQRGHWILHIEHIIIINLSFPCDFIFNSTACFWWELRLGISFDVIHNKKYIYGVNLIGSITLNTLLSIKGCWFPEVAKTDRETWFKNVILSSGIVLTGESNTILSGGNPISRACSTSPIDAHSTPWP